MHSLLRDKYKIVRVLGRGGMGTVYEAQERETGRRLAIKWMNEATYSEEDLAFLRFTQEARIGGALDSPHLTQVFECALEPEQGVVVQVMELHEGEDLRALLDRAGPLAPKLALRIAAQACRGLALAHHADVVHRDIKPENLFLARQSDGEVIVKILDFGIAKIRRDGSSGSRALTAPAVPMTTSGQMLGTPLFMAPEQIQGAKNVDARCDVYAMGVTLYAMLTGAPPRAEIKSLFHLLRAIAQESVPLVSERAPWVSEEISRVVERAMSADKDARYANAAELGAAIEALIPEGTTIRQEELLGITDAQKQPESVEPPAAQLTLKPAEMAVGDKPAEMDTLAPAKGGARGWPLWVTVVGLLVLALGLGVFVMLR